VNKTWVRIGNADEKYTFRGYKIIKPIWVEINTRPGDYLFVLKNGLFIADDDDKILIGCSPYEPAFEPKLVRISDIDKNNFGQNTLKEIKKPFDIDNFEFASYSEAKNWFEKRKNNEKI
jgi:hypothetical protein